MKGKQKVIILSTLAFLDCLFGGLLFSKYMYKQSNISNRLLGGLTVADFIASFDKDIKYDVYDVQEEVYEENTIGDVFDTVPGGDAVTNTNSKGIVSGTSITKKQVNNNKKQTKKTTTVPVAKASKGACTQSQYTGADIVKFAVQFNGRPYRAGGTSLTKGSDCSGFTMSVYAHFGIKLNRSARDQISNGMSLPITENGKLTTKYLKAGDILLYTQKGSKLITHVAIYTGNGKIIHARTPAQGIGYSKWNMNGYMNTVAARRIIC